MKKKLLFVFLSLFSVSAMASTASYLFLQTAANAQLRHDQGDKYTLTLHKGADHIGYFTNRPVRKSGLLAMDKFEKLWTTKKLAHNFTQEPPNVAIAMVMSNGQKQSFIAVMSKPVVKGKDVSYQLTKTSKKKVATGSSSNVVLFIDDINWNPGGF